MLRQLLTKKVLLGLSAGVLVVLMLGTADARFSSASTGQVLCCGELDLKIRDQDQGWRDCVSGTWQARNMAPGQSFDFSGSFNALKAKTSGVIGVGCSYRVVEEQPPAEEDTDPHTDLRPNRMAKCLALTRCVYTGLGFQIDCLTGTLTVSAKGKTASQLKHLSRSGWKLRDADGDGYLTFADFRARPLAGLPLLDGCRGEDARFEMSVRFVPEAGNWLQGDTLKLTLTYTFGIC